MNLRGFICHLKIYMYSYDSNEIPLFFIFLFSLLDFTMIFFYRELFLRSVIVCKIGCDRWAKWGCLFFLRGGRGTGDRWGTALWNRKKEIKGKEWRGFFLVGIGNFVSGNRFRVCLIYIIFFSNSQLALFPRRLLSFSLYLLSKFFLKKFYIFKGFSFS